MGIVKTCFCLNTVKGDRSWPQVVPEEFPNIQHETFFLWKKDQAMQQTAQGSSGVTILVGVQETVDVALKNMSIVVID